MRTKHYSIQTEKTYLLWIKRFIIFNQKRPPKDLGEQEVTDFLTYLAVKRHVTSSTQNLALCAIVFMYKHVFERELTLSITRYHSSKSTKTCAYRINP